MSLDLVITSLLDDPTLTVEAIYTPKVGDVRPIRLVQRKPSEIVGFQTTPIATETFKFRARASDFTGLAQPSIGDEFEIDSAIYEIQSEPIRSASGLTYSFDVRRAWT